MKFRVLYGRLHILDDAKLGKVMNEYPNSKVRMLATAIMLDRSINQILEEMETSHKRGLPASGRNVQRIIAVRKLFPLLTQDSFIITT